MVLLVSSSTVRRYVRNKKDPFQKRAAAPCVICHASCVMRRDGLLYKVRYGVVEHDIGFRERGNTLVHSQRVDHGGVREVPYNLKAND